jgi:hypothetical protein
MLFHAASALEDHAPEVEAFELVILEVSTTRAAVVVIQTWEDIWDAG